MFAKKDEDCSYPGEKLALRVGFSAQKQHHLSREHIKKQRPHFADKGPYSQSCGFCNSHEQM